MSIISSLAEKMVEGQSFGFTSFDEAKETINQKCGDKELSITYDRLSLYIYSHNLTPIQFKMLEMPLRVWLEKHNNEEQKSRIEYATLFLYSQIHPELQGAKIVKTLHPDFVVNLDGVSIGIEVTQLEKQSDSVMSKIISDLYRPGMKPNEVLALAFKKHGFKAREYSIVELQQDVLAFQHTEDMQITNAEFVKMIGKKLVKYKNQASEFDKFIVLCKAQYGITITGERDADNLICDVIEEFPDPKMNIAVLYIGERSIFQCAEYSHEDNEIIYS